MKEKFEIDCKGNQLIQANSVIDIWFSVLGSSGCRDTYQVLDVTLALRLNVLNIGLGFEQIATFSLRP